MTKTCVCCAREMALEQFRMTMKRGEPYRLARCRQCEAAEAGLRWHRNKNRPKPKTEEQLIGEAFRDWAWSDVRPLVATIGRIAA